MDETIEFDEELSSELLAAQAITELMELDRQKNGLSPRERCSPPPQIDPRFQSDYNNL
jgi:hypothetical protein